MTMDVVRKGVLYNKEIQDVGFFGAMTHPRLNAAFLASPVYSILLPLIGLWLSLLSILDAYELAKASNKNFDRVFQLVVSVSCAILSNVSIAGEVLSKVAGFAFSAGPAIFLSSVLLATVHQISMFVINAFRAAKTPENSKLRSHFLQTAMMHLYLSGLMTGITGTVLFVMLTPIAPIVGNIFAALTTVMVLGNILWRLMPEHWRVGLKTLLRLEPSVVAKPVGYANGQTHAPSRVVPEINKHHAPLFSQRDYSAEMQSLEPANAKIALLDLINKKIEKLQAQDSQPSIKTSDKLSMLQKLKEHLLERKLFDKNELLEQFPWAFQSFWLQMGEVESIVDAVHQHLSTNFQEPNLALAII